ncbi:MAG: hypothetical protein JWO06_1609 [Bacteroidota bacterium]|nr:hypothetical protein [Bacteroidota bacterium]
MTEVTRKNVFLVVAVIGVLMFGCKKNNPEPMQQQHQQPLPVDTVKTLADSLAGNYKMSGAWYHDYIAWDSTHTTVIGLTSTVATYTDTIITISVYNDSLLSMGGIPCSLNPGSATPYCFISNSTSAPYPELVLYKNYPDSAWFTIGLGRSWEFNDYIVLRGRKM